TGDNEDNNPYQSFNGNDHGTHVAGCAAATGDNGIGVVGPAYNVKIMATKHQPSNYGTNFIYNGYQGVYYCADSGAHIINCSWGGGGGSEIANTAATYAKDHGALMICAASNDNTDNTYYHYYPSDAIDAVSVAATDINDTKASFSNYGTPIDVSAPGVSILSTVYTMEGNNSYTGYQGTSMASPVAAGVAGLIKSMHPELTPMQLKERLQAGCDDIDSVNPQYIGKLGAGRVNAYNSLMYDKLPYVEMLSYEVTEIEGNNNAMVNPGENVQVKLNLKNRQNWLPASNLVLKLRSDNPMITITDSLISINSLAAGESIQSEDKFSFAVSNDFPVIQNAEFTVILNANQQNPYVYNDQFDLQIPVTCMRANWPYINDQATYFSPVIDDINNDGEKEIIFNDNQGKVYAMDKNAVLLDGFPVSLNAVCYAPVSILEQSNSKEIVVCSGNKVFRISGNGQVLSTFTAEGLIRITPLIADHNLDGTKDIVFGTIQRKVYSLKNDGVTLNTNYPISFDAATVSPIAVGKSGVLYIANNNGILHAISPNGALNQFAPFPYQYSGVSMNGPIVLSDNTGENESIIISGNRTNGNRISIIRKSNDFVTSIATSNSVSGGPIPVKNNDQTVFVYTTVDGKITCINGFGQILFEINCETLLDPSPVSVDINGDDTDEVMITSTNGTIQFYNVNGELISEKTINLNMENRLTPTISAIDEPNNLDILIPSFKKMNYLDTRIPFNSSDWPVYRGNNQRTANVSNFPLTYDDNSAQPVQYLNLRNYPNPFNPMTDIMFNLEKETDCEINIFNVKGQLVENLFSGKLKKGTHSIKWDAEKNRKALSSGIYFCQFKSSNASQIKKLLLLK
ncbi:MAG TPA: S8 family serine peptidase, partial [Candidatus Cloacimonadota bacterium]|nr:S8 family serine peptidase [Candidatus Cloacimonadota bacterium]